MSVADMFNTPLTPEDMAKWASLHMALHRDTNAAILRIRGIALPEYVLSPVDMNDPGPFLNQHSTMHAYTDQILGIAGVDLSEVDWSDTSQREGWIWLNATLHAAESDALETFD